MPLESVGDYLLPDYLTDVRRVLHSSATVDRVNVFEGEEELGIEGAVLIRAIYLDTEDKLSSLEFRTEIDTSLKWDKSVTECSELTIAVEKLGLRLMGPRKFSARVGLCLLFDEAVVAVHSVDGDALNGREPECDCIKVDMIEFKRQDYEKIAVSEQVEFIEGAIEDEISVLALDIAPVDLSVNGVGELKGQTEIRMLIRRGEEYPLYLTRTVPFEDSLPDMPKMGDHLRPVVEITDRESRIVADENGVRIEVSYTVNPRLLSYGNTRRELIRDCYLQELETHAEYGELDYLRLCGGLQGRADVEIQKSAEELGVGRIREALYHAEEARCEEITVNDKYVHVVGKIRVSGIACEINEENIPSYCSLKLDLPFDINVNNSCHIGDDSILECQLSAQGCELYFDRESVRLSGKLDYSIVATEEQRSHVLTSLTIGDEPVVREEAVVTVYYPTSSESLFGIAKTFHTSVLKIARDNSLTEEVFADKSGSVLAHGVRKLIIR